MGRSLGEVPSTKVRVVLEYLGDVARLAGQLQMTVLLTDWRSTISGPKRNLKRPKIVLQVLYQFCRGLGLSIGVQTFFIMLGQ